jgi:phenylacetate-CoA ligase
MDAMTLQVECAAPEPALRDGMIASLRDVTRLRGEVAFVAPGSLPNDGKVIEDRRKLD